MTEASQSEIDLARQIYSGDTTEISDDAPAKHEPDGVWIQAWVFVSNESIAVSGFGALN